MQEKVIRGHWGDLWALIVPQKSLFIKKNSNISRYIEQQRLIINVMTHTTIWTVIMKLSTLELAYIDQCLLLLGAQSPSNTCVLVDLLRPMVYKWNKNKALPVYNFDFDAHVSVS